MPRFTYRVTRPLIDIIDDERAFGEIAGLVRADLERLVATCEIEDITTARKVQNTLLALDVLEGCDEAARERISFIRSLHNKAGSKLISGLVADSVLTARLRLRRNEAADYASAVRQRITEVLRQVSSELVREDLKRLKARLDLQSAAMARGLVEAELEPAARTAGTISGEVAELLVAMRYTTRIVLPICREIVEALNSYLEAHRSALPDMWRPRSVALPPRKRLAPIVIAVWDSGVETGLFRDRLCSVDGCHGIAWDLRGQPSCDLLYPLTPEQRTQYPAIRTLVKGFIDTQAGLSSPEAASFRLRVADLRPQEVKEFIEGLNLALNYMHGTHVAGIVLEGNPFAQLLIARVTWDHHVVTEVPAEQTVLAQARAHKRTVAFCRRGQARVVNMSWTKSPNMYERDFASLRSATTQNRTRGARRLFDIEKVALQEAIAGAPEILFVTAAGNTNSNTSFEDSIPSSLKLANLITVGAVGPDGQETPFSSFGPDVAVHANGSDVESCVPGGGQLALSGTSMAAAAVSNLAGKLFALNPRLTPTDVIGLIKVGADRSRDGRRLLINPRKSVELLTGGSLSEP